MSRDYRNGKGLCVVIRQTFGETLGADSIWAVGIYTDPMATTFASFKKIRFVRFRVQGPLANVFEAVSIIGPWFLEHMNELPRPAKLCPRLGAGPWAHLPLLLPLDHPNAWRTIL